MRHDLRKRRPAPAQRGVSMVEIMVALLLGLVLVAGVGQIYLSSKQTYRMQDAQSRLQENARYALELLSHDIRLAGYMGCKSGAITPTVIANSPITAITPTTVITGGDNSAGSFANPTPALSNNLSNVVQNTDAITVQFGESCGAVTTGAISNPSDVNLSFLSTVIPAANSCTLTDQEPMALADCNAAHIFRVGQANNTASLNRTYSAGSELMLFRSYAYYIRLNSANQPALYRYDNTSNSSYELVEGIEDMQISYGLDTDTPADGSANQYVASSAVANWAQVVGVRITLRVRSLDDNLAENPRTYSFNGGNVTDRRLARTFTATIGIRNPLQ